jgi:hypothetical protein
MLKRAHQQDNSCVLYIAVLNYTRWAKKRCVTEEMKIVDHKSKYNDAILVVKTLELVMAKVMLMVLWMVEIVEFLKPI